MPNTFTARYHGRCAECGEPIEPGDEIGYLDNEICCEDCIDQDDDCWGMCGA